jgi:hypothetical protein
MKVPNTISDKEMKKLRERAQRVAPPSTSNKAVKQRKDSSKQSFKAEQS